MNSVQHQSLGGPTLDAIEVQLHLKTQDAFRRLMASARKQLGFSEAAVSQRMMLMSLPTDVVLVFKDRLSRTSLLFNTVNERVEIPHGLANRWDEIWGEFLSPVTRSADMESSDEYETVFRAHRLYMEGVALAKQYLETPESYEKTLAMVRLKRIARQIEEDIRETPVCGFALMVKDANSHIGT